MSKALNARIDILEAQLAILNSQEDPRQKIDEWFKSLYPWQIEFINSTKENMQTMLCAANRIGKTYTGLGIDACHIMGHYPDGWGGYVFENKTLCWLLGYSGEKTKDLLQTPLFGRVVNKQFTGGIIPAHLIDSYESMSGTSGAVRSVYVNGFKGQTKTQFWSYSQGQHALMGDSVDWFHIDEEPRDQNIYPQVLTRTATGDGNKGGRGILTLTPENGKTETVVKFMDKPSKGQAFIQKGWDDAPHLSEETKEQLLAGFPPHQRDMRTKGYPMLGHGRIYDMSEDFFTCDPFEIPSHFAVINGMDFGYDHPQAHIQLAIDNDNDIIYVTNAWKAEKVSANDAWGAVKAWSKDVPVAWPHDGLQHEKGRDDAKQQKDHYEDAGFSMLGQRSTWDGKSNSVEQGIYEIRERMQTGKFKIFRGCRCLIDEINQYHRDDKGKIVKSRDDAVDAMRYAYMMRRFAICKGELHNANKIKETVVMPVMNNW